MLQAIGIEVRARARTLLRDVSLEVAPGEFVAIIGPNGAGKSTLLNALAGDRPLSSGEILLDGRPFGQWSKRELARRRAVLPQHSAVAFDFTGLQIAMLGLLAFRGSLSEREMQALAERALAETEALAFADRPYTVLSGGERQRVQLARVLAQCDADPAATPFLLLDEPITGPRSLAPACRPRQRTATRRSWTGRARRPARSQHGGALCRRVGIVEDGRVTNLGPTRETLAPDRLSHVFATPIVRIETGSGTAFLSPG